ncbi:MAG: hypothetical protein FGM55_00940 [Rhodoferax sp.]|nr:hypothetical protein [Rhodoferax sp.]
MNLAQPAALFFTVALLMVTTYFLLGSVPLLILKHDNPMDASFIRTFYKTYYRIALPTAAGATLSYLLAARPAFALGAAANAALIWAMRGRFLPRMAELASGMQAQPLAAIPAFRAMHRRAILISLGQLVAIVGSLGFL